MLGAQQSNALGSHATRARRIGCRVGIGAHQHAARSVGMAHDAVDGLDELARRVIGIMESRRHALLEVADHRAGHDGHLAQEDLAGAAIDRDDVALGDDRAVRGGDALG